MQRKLPKARLPYAWSLEKDGVKSHIVGSSHIAVHDFSEDLTKLLEGKVNLAKEIVATREEGHREAAKSTISEYLGTMTEKEIRILMGLTGLNRNNIGRLTKAHFSALPYILAASTMPVAIMEAEITDIATQNGIRVYGLEDLSPQIKTLEEIDHLKCFRKAIKVARTRGISVKSYMVRKALTIMEEYERGEAESSLTDPEVSDFIENAAKRNRPMVEASLELLTEPTLVIVGAAHTVGVDAMPELYGEAGFKVERI